MKKQLGLLATLMLTGVAACGGADQEVGTGDGAYATESAIIAFGGDWSIEQTGRLVEGGAVRVKYDSSRLPTCRGNQNGGPAWTITGYYSLNGGDPGSFFVDGFSPTSAPDEPTFTLDEPGELGIWFENTSRWGCSAFDSNFGDNFNFDVAQAGAEPPAGSSALLTFGADGTPKLSGKLARGGELRIDYAPERLTDCRVEQGGGPAWTITGYYSIGGSEAQTFYVAGFSPTSTVTTPLISLDRSGELEIWFQNTSRWGCSGFDSNDGANYTYTVK
jgi:uncharacterized protein YodC (DUF2158 family)